MHQLKLKKRPSGPKTVSEKIHDQFASSARKATGDDSDEDTRPQVTEFDENDGEIERAAGAGLSDIRKSNVRLLDSVDRKYHGKVASRRDVFEEEEDGSDEESDPEAGAFVRLNRGGDQESDDEESDEFGSESDSEENEDEEQDFSLGDFMGEPVTESQKLLQDENRQEAVQKGICVQNQLKMWERLLEMRIKMQGCLSTANSLPHEDKFASLSQNDQFKEAASKVVQTVESTLNNLLELQSTLIAKFPETKDLSKSGSKRKLKDHKTTSKAKSFRTSDFEPLLSETFTSYKPYRNDVIQKWHDRTRASSSSRNAHQSLSVLKKIDNALLSKDDLIHKTQLFRGGYTLFTQPASEPAPKRNDEDENNGEKAGEPELYDGEIYDDSDFYHALLRELIEYKSNSTENPQEIGAKLAELQKLRSKMKKQVDTRASKGRKIRYVVHKKLVNFTAPEYSHGWTEEAKDELFSSLFGATSKEG